MFFFPFKQYKHETRVTVMGKVQIARLFKIHVSLNNKFNDFTRKYVRTVNNVEKTLVRESFVKVLQIIL